MRPLLAARVLLMIAAALCGLFGPAFALRFVSPQGFAVTAPLGWRIFPNSSLGTEAVFVAAAQNGFADNVNVVVVPTPPGDSAPPVKTLRRAGAAVRAALARQFTQYHLLSQGMLMVSGAPALQVISSYTLGTPPKALKTRQVYILRGHTCYIVTLTTLAGRYPHEDTLFSAMLRSLHWTK